MISVFQPQKQCTQQQQQQDNRNAGGNGRKTMSNNTVGAGAAGRLMQGNMSQILTDPAVQQMLQNIGDAGRLGKGPVGMQEQGGSAMGMPGGMPMWNDSQQQQQNQRQQQQQQYNL